MKIYFFSYILVVGLLTNLLQANDRKQNSQDSFVLTKKQTKKIKGMSKDTLKERLGESTRDAFHCTTELASTIGSMQILMSDKKQEKTEKEEKNFLQVSLDVHQKIGLFQVELASLQKRFSWIIENLIDNQTPFKKAGKEKLSAAYKAMMAVSRDLKQELDQSKKTYEQLKQDKKNDILISMKNINQVGTELTNKLKQIDGTLAQHECLKQA